MGAHMGRLMPSVCALLRLRTTCRDVTLPASTCICFCSACCVKTVSCRVGAAVAAPNLKLQSTLSGHIYRAVACLTCCSLNKTAVIVRNGHSGLWLDSVSGSCCRCCRLQNQKLDFRHQHFLPVDVRISCLYDATGICLGESHVVMAVSICENVS